MSKEKNSPDIEIDYIKIYKVLIKEKIILLIFPLLIAIMVFIYSLQLTKKYEATVRISPPGLIPLTNYQNFFSERDYSKLDKEFFTLFFNKLNSNELFFDFFISNPQTKTVVKKFKNNGLNIRSIIEKSFKIELEKTSYSKIELFKVSFVYNKDLNGEKLINDYVSHIKNSFFIDINKRLIDLSSIELDNQSTLRDIYVKNQKRILQDKLISIDFTIDEYIKNRKLTLEGRIFQLQNEIEEVKSKLTRLLAINLKKHKQALSVAKDLGIIETMQTNIIYNVDFDFDGDISSILNDPQQLFYKGTKALSSLIENIEDDLNNLENTEAFSNKLSEIEKIQNQLLSLDKTDQYYMLLADRKLIEYKINKPELFPEYSKFLNQENLLKNKIELIKKVKWNSFTEQAVVRELILIGKFHIFLGFLFGLLLALVTIFFKNYKSLKKFIINKD